MQSVILKLITKGVFMIVGFHHNVWVRELQATNLSSCDTIDPHKSNFCIFPPGHSAVYQWHLCLVAKSTVKCIWEAQQWCFSLEIMSFFVSSSMWDLFSVYCVLKPMRNITAQPRWAPLIFTSCHPLMSITGFRGELSFKALEEESVILIVTFPNIFFQQETCIKSVMLTY